MPYTNGVFALYSTGNPTVSGTTISSVWANATLSDLATGLSTCMLKDGTQTTTANIPMAGFKFTNLGVGSATTDSASLAQVQNGFGSFLTSVAGTNTVTATATPTPSYTVGQRFTFVPAVTNTGATTLNISSLGAGAVQLDGAALAGGELEAGRAVTVYVTATTPVFEIVGPSPATGSTASTFTFNGTGGTSGSVTMNYQKIGNYVTLNIPAISATTGTGSTTFTADTALPAAFRPATIQEAACNSNQDNAAPEGSAAVFQVGTDGVVNYRRNNASLAFTNGAAAGTTRPVSFTYFIG